MRDLDDHCKKVDEIAQKLIPGEPLLIIGRNGCGKILMTESACEKIGLKHRVHGAAWIDKTSLQIITQMKQPGTAALIESVDYLPGEMVDDLRHWLATSSRTIVLFAEEAGNVDATIMAMARHLIVVR